MRYVGQGYEVDAPVDLATIQTGNISAIAGSFSDAYLKRFGRTEKMPPEITTWRVVVSGPRPPLLDSIRVNHQQRASALTPKTARPVYFGAEVGFVETPVFDRETLGPGALIDGPAVLEEVESTLIIPPDFSGEVDEGLNVVVSRKDQTS
jgi:N-methylhydantoinase A